jgi:nucleoside 2-deoxyribosyltransferase
MMKIYFAGSIRAGRDDAAIYEILIAKLKTFGTVLTEHVGDKTLSVLGDDGPDDRFIHNLDMAWLKSCDCVVAEVTIPSLGVGYELGWAVALDKPILCLYRPLPERPLSAMIAGSYAITTIGYSSLEDVWPLLENFINRIVEKRGLLPGA